jgi:small-conductance mechanosensitive channel
LGLALELIKKLDIKKTKVDDKARGMLVGIVEIVGRVVLVLVILDYLGIGRTIIAALTQGVTFAIAIALGFAFGKALEDDAKKVIENLRNLFKE